MHILFFFNTWKLAKLAPCAAWGRVLVINVSYLVLPLYQVSRWYLIDQSSSYAICKLYGSCDNYYVCYHHQAEQPKLLDPGASNEKCFWSESHSLYGSHSSYSAQLEMKNLSPPLHRPCNYRTLLATLLVNGSPNSRIIVVRHLVFRLWKNLIMFV